MTDSKQTEAARLANQLDYHREYDLGVTHTGIDEQAAAELRRQQAEIERLNEALAQQPAPMIRGDIRDGLVDDEPAHQHIEHCLWARNGNQPCPHVQPAQQEPVGYFKLGGFNVWWQVSRADSDIQGVVPLYASPPAQRTWVGLTRAERFEIEKAMSKYYDYQHECKTVCLPEFARAIEAKLKEKNSD